jgi:hypothetical protein
MHDGAQLLERLLEQLKGEFGDDLLGVLITGSRVHGTPDPTSDLDVHVVIDLPRRRRKNIVLDGLEIEMFFNPPYRVRRYFEDEHGGSLHMFTFGRAIYDPKGILAELQAEARTGWERGPQPIPEEVLILHRYGPADLLRDLQDVGEGDEATANLLIVQLVDSLIDTHCRLRGQWPHKVKRRLASLAQWDALAAQLARSALSAGSLADRRAAVAHLAEHVLAPIGGLAPLAWEMPWEELAPPQA